MNEDIFHLGIKAIIRNQKGEILLLKVNKETLKGYSGDAYWDIPGGRIHKGSSIEETLKREVEEETGIRNIKSIKPFSMVLSNIRIPTSENGTVGLILSSYICEIEETIQITLSEEHREDNWFLPEEASKLLEFKYPKEFTEAIKNFR